MAPTTAAPQQGIISEFESYTLVEFKRRTGLKDWAVRKPQRSGFPVIRLGENGGGAAFILGKDWIGANKGDAALFDVLVSPAALRGRNKRLSG